MMRMIARPTWFATLRRDQRLFALLTLFLVLAHSLQPLAVAKASASGHLVICTMLGAEPLPDGTPIHRDSCGECVVGAYSMQAAAKAIIASDPAWEPLETVAFDAHPAEHVAPFAWIVIEQPPGIRAPPLDA